VKYPDPNGPLDKNIQDSIANLDNAEKGLGKKLDLLATRIAPSAPTFSKAKLENKMA